VNAVRIHPEALAEAEDAVAWYRQRSERAAREFLVELGSTIDRITKNPEQFAPGEFGTRRAVLHRFPYLVVVRVTADDIEIVAIAHGRRKPGYWRGRTH
jgi:toxin ParE1/3/4